MARKQREDSARKIKSLETKDRLFNAAFRLLSEKGFDEISVREITGAANTSIGTFYTYFQSKQDVYYQTYSLADRYFQNTVLPRMNSAAHSENILTFFDQYARYNAEISGLNLCRILYTPTNRYFNRSDEIGMLPILRKAISAGQEAGQFLCEKSAEYIADFLMNAARGLVYNWVTRNGDFDLRAEMRGYCELWLKSIKN